MLDIMQNVKFHAQCNETFSVEIQYLFSIKSKVAIPMEIQVITCPKVITRPRSRPSQDSESGNAAGSN